MRKLVSMAFIALLVALVAMPATAAPTDLDQTGLSIPSRVIDIVTGWLAKFGSDFDSNDAKSDDGSDDDFPPLDGIGPPFDSESGRKRS